VHRRCKNGENNTACVYRMLRRWINELMRVKENIGAEN
jgi:hypothetical protein